MSDEMGTTTTVPTESESRLAGTEQVKHTPGPWNFLEQDYATGILHPRPWTICDADCNDLANIYSEENATVKISRDASIANAQLMAAAPAMLAALKEAQYFFSEDFPDGPDAANIATPRYEEAYRAILAAIAKAEGRTP